MAKFASISNQVLLRRFLIVTLLLSSSVIVFAQEEEGDDCPVPESKNAIKLYEKSQNRKKYEYRERLQFLHQAVEEEPEYVDAWFALGEAAVRGAKLRGTSTKPIVKYFRQVITLCPQFHSDPYYYLAEVALGNKEYEQAVDMYNKFILFSSDDDSKFAKDYEVKYSKAEENYKYAKFFADGYANPVPFNPLRVEKISTKNGEYLPMISPDNKSMYFTRRTVDNTSARSSSMQSDKTKYIERFTAAQRTGELEFEEGKPLDAPFNQNPKHNYGGAAISLDNKHMFLTICKPGKGGYTNCDIFYTDYVYDYNEKTGKTEWHWTELQNMGPNINGEYTWEAQPSLAADGKTLFFSSARENTTGGIDIYFSRKGEDGQWGPAINIGPPINTSYNDKAPFIHSDSKTLYFSSQTTGDSARVGFGGYDIFYTRATPEGFTEPKNIGYPINTEEDEHGFIVNTNGKEVYFASNKYNRSSDGTINLDILSFELYEEARPQEVVFLSGEVKDENGEVAKNAVVEIKNMKTKKIQKINVDSVDGTYAAVVTLENEDDDFLVNIKGEETAFNSRLISSKDSTKGTFREMDVEVEKLQIGKAYRINDIHYATNSADLTEDSKKVLDEFILYLKDNSSIRFEVHGHTDNVGDEADNMALSSDRAYSVLAYLQENGIAKGRVVQFKGFGETKPIASNETEEGRAVNRRTEFVIVSK